MSEPVRTERRGRVIEITIDNPPANAIGRRVTAGLSRAFATLRDDPELLVGIVTGAGDKFFSPGWDLKEAAASQEQGGDAEGARHSRASRRRSRGRMRDSTTSGSSGPTCLSTILPRASMMKVSGSPYTPKSRPVRPSGS